MEQFRGGKLKRRSWNWRSLLVSTGALGYWCSILGQIGWNAFGALGLGDSTWEDDQESLSSVLKTCVDQALSQRQLDRYCSAALTPYAGLALVLGVLSLWWNPRLSDRVERRNGRLAGLDEYYRIQIFVLVARFVAWACIQDPSMSGLDPGVLPAIHIFMAIFTIIVSILEFLSCLSPSLAVANFGPTKSVIMSRRAVQFNTTPIVSWQQPQEPLISRNPGTSQNEGTPFQSQPESQATPVQQRFPINNLAQPQAQTVAPYNPPTPPPDIMDDSDAMDWTPSQFSLQPNHSITRHVQQQPLSQASPFHGQLPAAPNPPAWQLRNTPNRQVASHSAETPKPNPFNRGPVDSTPKLNLNQEAQQHEPAAETPFAPPKFFPPKDYAADTGLESLFNNAFSIADEPADVQKTRWQQMTVSGNHSDTRTLANARPHILKCVLLSFSLLAWFFAEKRSGDSKHIEIISLAVACLVAGFSLLETLKKPVAARSLSDIILSLAELVASAFLGGTIPRGSSDGIFFTKAGECLLSFMAAQEMMALVWPRYLSTSPSTEESETTTMEPSPRPGTRDTGSAAGSVNTPYSEGISSAHTVTPRQNVQFSPSPSPAFSVASSSHSSSIASPFQSRDAALDVKTPLRSQKFAPAAATRSSYSPMPSFIGFSLNDNDSPQTAAARPAAQATRRYPVRARRS